MTRGNDSISAWKSITFKKESRILAGTLIVVILFLSMPSQAAIVIEGRTKSPLVAENPIKVTIGSDALRSDMVDPGSKDQVSVIITAPWETLNLMNITKRTSIDLPIHTFQAPNNGDMIKKTGLKKSVGKWTCEVYRYVSQRRTQDLCVALPSTLGISKEYASSLPYFADVLKWGWSGNAEASLRRQRMKMEGLDKMIILRIVEYVPGTTSQLWEFDASSVEEKPVTTMIFQVPADFKHKATAN